MAGPGDIRAGGAYVEITGDSGGLKKALQDSESDFKKFRDEAEKINAKFKTPLQKLNEEMERAKSLGDKGWLSPEIAKKQMADLEKQMADLGKRPSFLKSLKSQFGEDSQFGLGVKTLMGAGALAGVGLVAQRFERMGTAMAEAATKLRAGQISYSEYVGELVKSVPIIGSVIGGIEGISEAITGAKAKADAVRAAQSQGQQVLDSTGFTSSGYDFSGADKRTAAIERQLGFKKMGALERIRGEAAAGYNDRIFEINAERQAAIQAVRDRNQKQLDDLQKVAEGRGKYSGIQRAEATSKIEEIQQRIEREIGDIRKAAAREVAANQKARDEAVGEAEKKNADEQKAAREAGIKYAVNATKGLMGFVLGGGGRSIIDHTKDAVFRANNFAGSAMDVSGVVTGKTDGKLDSILTAVNNFATMVGQKLPIDATPRAT